MSTSCNSTWPKSLQPVSIYKRAYLLTASPYFAVRTKEIEIKSMPYRVIEAPLFPPPNLALLYNTMGLFRKKRGGDCIRAYVRTYVHPKPRNIGYVDVSLFKKQKTEKKLSLLRQANQDDLREPRTSSTLQVTYIPVHIHTICSMALGRPTRTNKREASRRPTYWDFTRERRPCASHGLGIEICSKTLILPNSRDSGLAVFRLLSYLGIWLYMQPVLVGDGLSDDIHVVPRKRATRYRNVRVRAAEKKFS
ncbi:hypothetical protein F5X99DRAFT_393826 [Biscogniauxia marginata]|nr:hypothetical protein F5X99DRAFT_393826 [Biscogniauxia marginata]